MSLTIYERVADCEQPLFVIAELGLNHGGDVERALRLVDGAARAGAAAIKVQAFRADRLVAPACPAPAHVEARSLRAFFQGYELDADALARIASRAHALGLAAVATPFDEDVVGVLESAGYDAYKIASGDLTYTALIERAAMTGKPVLMSTGMSDMDDIRVAMEHARAAGGRQLGLLHCVSAYPTPSGQENIAALTQIRRAFGVEVGLSDHSTEPLSIPMAVALGASFYERHLALEAEPDQIERAVSSTPSELADLIALAARARAALGDGRKVCRTVEKGNRIASRRSLHAARALRAGDLLDPTSVTALRPATGIDPRYTGEVVGRRLARDIEAGEPLYGADLVGWVSREKLRDVA